MARNGENRPQFGRAKFHLGLVLDAGRADLSRRSFSERGSAPPTELGTRNPELGCAGGRGETRPTLFSRIR